MCEEDGELDDSLVALGIEKEEGFAECDFA